MELHPYARRLLDLTREARTPTAADRKRVDRALSAALGFAVASSVSATGAAATSTAAASAVTSGATKSGVAALVFKWTAGVAVVASAVTAGYYQLADDAPKHEPKPAARALAVAKTPPPEQAPAATEASQAAEAPVAPSESAKPPARRAAPSDSAKKPDTLAEELDLLHEAQRKWRSRNSSAALSLIAQHEQRYPKSALRQEREALRVLALCAAGRTDEARQVARRSFRNAPRSPLRTTVEESCVKE